MGNAAPSPGRQFRLHTASIAAGAWEAESAVSQGSLETIVTSAIIPTYARADLAFERGDGVWLVGTNGERYLDCGAGIAVTSLGHGHPHLVAALTEQAQKLWHVSNLYQIPEGERLARRLVDATFADMAFFTNSGAEALEFAVKTARKYHASEGHPERFHVITFEGAFHGRTIAMVAAGGNPKYIEGFGPKAPGFDPVPFNDLAAVEAAIGPQTAAILVEPIQGEGGIRVADPAFLEGLRALCDRHRLMLIFDEVQCGVGRTGKLFQYQNVGVAPDLLAFAKGIGGGFPLGGCLAIAEAAKGMVAGTHGTTYGGNPLAMAVGNAVLDMILAPGFLEDVARKGLLLRQRLAELEDRHPAVIAGTRGVGLMLGLVTRVPPGDFVAEARRQHLLTIPAAENAVRLLPPLTITDDEIGEAVTRLDRTCVAIEQAAKTTAAKGTAA
jgi:acetylornithine/N-succinyldiaminopimelate aminotransferase